MRTWQQGRELVRLVYADFGRGTSAERDWGFRDQVQRAALSITNNISEGFEVGSDQQFSKFLGYAKGSCGEVRNMYYTASDLGYVTEEVAVERRVLAVEISRGLGKLITYLNGCSNN